MKNQSKSVLKRGDKVRVDIAMATVKKLLSESFISWHDKIKEVSIDLLNMVYCECSSDLCRAANRRKEGNVLFNDALNTFYLRLYGVRHMVKDHSDSEKGNPLPPHRLLFPINSKGSFICTIPQTG